MSAVYVVEHQLILSITAVSLKIKINVCHL